MSRPTVSFCIPTHGRSHMLLEALESGLAQTRPPDEIVVSDDLGNAEARELVAAFARRAPFPVRYIHCTTGTSQANNMNNCLREAAGDLTLMLHDDDLLFPCAIEALIRPFEENANLVAAYGKQWFITDKGEDVTTGQTERVNRVHRRTPENIGLQKDTLLAGLSQQFPNDGYLVRTSVAREVLYKPEFRAATDFEFGVRLSERGYFYFVDVFTAKYRNSDDSVGRGANWKSDDSAYFAMLILERFLASHPDHAPEILERMKNLSPMSIRMAANTGRLGKAVKWYFGPYHRHRICSLGGLARGAFLTQAWLQQKFSRSA